MCVYIYIYIYIYRQLCWLRIGTLSHPAAKHLSPLPNSCRQAALCLPARFQYSLLPGEILKLGVGDNFGFLITLVSRKGGR